MHQLTDQGNKSVSVDRLVKVLGIESVTDPSPNQDVITVGQNRQPCRETDAVDLPNYNH